MKKTIKNINRIAISGLGLSALSTANASMGGTNLVGNLAQGYGQMLPATGTLMGTSMLINSTKLLKKRGK